MGGGMTSPLETCVLLPGTKITVRAVISDVYNYYKMPVCTADFKRDSTVILGGYTHVGHVG